MQVHDLRERRAEAVSRMRQLADAPEGQGGDLSEAQAKEFDSLKGDVAALEGRIARAEHLEALERRADATPIDGGRGEADFETRCREFSLLRAIDGQMRGRVDGLEAEVSAELERRRGRKSDGIAAPMQALEKRVVTTGSTPAGSNLIATDHAGGQFISLLRAASVVQRAGARVLSGLTGNLDIPREKASPAVAWVGENGALTPGDAAFDTTPLTPKHAGVLTEYSRNMIQQSSPDVESLFRELMARDLAGALDKAALRGGGSNEPVGVLATDGIGDHSATAPGRADVWKLIELVETANATPGSFVMSPAVAHLLRTTPVEVDGSDVAVSADYVMAARDALQGLPAFVTNQLANTFGSPADDGALLLGDFSELLVGYWSSFDLLVNPYESTAYSKGNVQIRAMLTADVAVRHKGAFAAIADIVIPS